MGKWALAAIGVVVTACGATVPPAPPVQRTSARTDSDAGALLTYEPCWQWRPLANLPDGMNAIDLRDGTFMRLGYTQAEGGWRYDLATQTAHPIPGAPDLQHGSTFVFDDGRVLLAGGEVGADLVPSSATRMFDPATETWSSLPDLPGPQIDGTMVRFRNGVALGGGSFSPVDGFPNPAFPVFDVDAGNWGPWTAPIVGNYEALTADADGRLFALADQSSHYAGSSYVMTPEVLAEDAGWQMLDPTPFELANDLVDDAGVTYALSFFVVTVSHAGFLVQGHDANGGRHRAYFSLATRAWRELQPVPWALEYQAADVGGRTIVIPVHVGDDDTWGSNVWTPTDEIDLVDPETGELVPLPSLPEVGAIIVTALEPDHLIAGSNVLHVCW